MLTLAPIAAADAVTPAFGSAPVVADTTAAPSPTTTTTDNEDEDSDKTGLVVVQLLFWGLLGLTGLLGLIPRKKHEHVHQTHTRPTHTMDTHTNTPGTVHDNNRAGNDLRDGRADVDNDGRNDLR